ncbi:glycosyltransferase family 2 protein [Deinococcus yavapaiensis]|uniref:GT2 family glycosyltransferase n=1 Tax=Deinococcus yavapaiensis KR-236 TaxID=694435 RepID=A0A318S8Y1_9DEIO|nr:glycosyltransferase family 2 protein [Deinococcus yavapaiensis]PYE55650.1 GT2 family glycosyltransferase [Deinococcus yavapaiensis KR-236]
MSNPVLSIIIVSYDSRADLELCLPSLYAQNVQDIELIVVDNHTRDGVAEWLTAHHPKVRVLLNAANTGYAGGNNLGLRHATGTWVLFLNPDTEASPECLKRLLSTARDHPNALITPKLLQPDGTINACGNSMHFTGITTCRALSQPAASIRGLHETPLLSGAAILALTDVVRALGGFDERYFMYHEDTDLSLRARLLGYQLLCDAEAEVVHHYTLGMSPRKFRFMERNRLMTFLKVFSTRTLVQLLPGLLLTEAATWVFALRNSSYARAKGQSYRDLFTSWHSLRRERSRVQRSRRASDNVLLEHAEVALPLDQLMAANTAAALNRLVTPLYRVTRPRFVR